MSTISAVVLTHNNENTIERCLQSLSWCSEIIIIDDNSTDITLDIADRFKVKIYRKKMNNSFSSQRNYALTLCQTEWIFFVDADEEVSGELAKEIAFRIIKSRDVGYYIRRVDMYEGKPLRFGEFLHFKILRLARKGSGKWSGDVHETWGVEGDVGTLSHVLHHLPQGGVRESLQKINIYSTLRAHELKRMGKSSYFLSILLYPAGKFVQNFILKFGILDGIPGLLNAVNMSFYSFLVRSKLWLLVHGKTNST